MEFVQQVALRNIQVGNLHETPRDFDLIVDEVGATRKKFPQNISVLW